MQNTDAAQTETRPRAIGTVAAVAAGLLAAAGLGAAAVGFTSTLSAPASPTDPCASVSATAEPQSGGGSAGLRDGVACAITDTLVQQKIRRDIAQKFATDLREGRIDPTKLTGPQIAAIQSCAVTLAQAAASGAVAGDQAAAAAAAAAAPTKPCTDAANLTGTR